MNEESNNWCDFPQDLIRIVSDKIGSLKMKFFLKATCKSWNEALPVSSLVARFTCWNDAYMLYFPLTNERFIYSNECYAEGMKGLKVCRSKDGWLLMAYHMHYDDDDDEETHFFFYNPFTRTKVEIPPIEDYYYQTTFFFTSPPTNSDCQVFALQSSSDPLRRQVLSYTMTHLRIGEAWSVSPLLSRVDDVSFNGIRVLYKGLFYFLNGDAAVCVCDPCNNGNGGSVVHPTSFKNGTKLNCGYLLEVDAKLLGIFFPDPDYILGPTVVQSLDVESWEWHAVGPEELRDKILYVTSNGFYVQHAKGIGNRIYFAQSHKEVEVYYSLDTHTYHSIDGQFSSETSKGLTHWVRGNWIGL